VYLGALAEIITLVAGIGTAVALYPILRRQSKGLALGYVTVRVVEPASRRRPRQPARGGNAYDQVSGPSGILTLPEAIWEFSLGI
jgi:hypothetical protein